MKYRIKKELIQALRGGEYEQGYDVLCKPGKEFDYFCVIGVLGDLWCIETGNGYELVDGRYYLLGEIGRLAPEILKWAGITDKESCLLAELNDGESEINNNETATFEWIADFIESNF